MPGFQQTISLHIIQKIQVRILNFNKYIFISDL